MLTWLYSTHSGVTPAAAHKKRKVSSISENPPSTSISNFTPPMQTHPRSSVQYSQPSHATCVSTSLDHRPDTCYPAVNQLPSSSSQSSQSGTYTFSSPPEADHLMRPPTSHATWDTRPSFAPGSQNVDFPRAELWSAVHVGMAIVCACLPNFRPLLNRITASARRVPAFPWEV